MSRPLSHLDRLRDSLAGDLITSDMRLVACEGTDHGKPWHCCHQIQHLLWVTHGDNTRHVKWVCDVCGWHSQALKTAAIAPEVLESIGSADPAVRERWETAQREALKKMYQVVEREERMTDRQRAYAEWLKTPRWRQLRNERLKLDGYVCQGCGGTATTAHHVWYPVEEHWDDTPLWTLVSLCEDCHKIAHTIYSRGAVPWGVHDGSGG